MPLGHLGINVPDLARAKAYYDELMPLVDHEPFFEAAGEFSPHGFMLEAVCHHDDSA